MKQRRDGGRVGRRDDRADQQPAGPGRGEELGRGSPDDYRRGDDADRRQSERRPQHAADGARIGAQPAIEQNDGEANAAGQVGGLKIAEEDAAGPLLAGQHAQAEEGQQ